jgi:hypothetical protein
MWGGTSPWQEGGGVARAAATTALCALERRFGRAAAIAADPSLDRTRF